MPIASSCPRPTPPGQALHIMLQGHVCWFFLFAGLVMGIGSFMTAQESGHAAAPTALIGASMAVLAMFQDADVLPPENTPESNRIIKSVIQFQSVFIRGSDPDVQAFVHNALAAQRG